MLPDWTRAHNVCLKDIYTLLHEHFPVGTKAGKTCGFGSSSREPELWTFVVFFDWFTGLQYRSQGYLYLIACIVFASEPTPVPEGRFRRFVIRFCGSTYNTVNHLNVILGPKTFSRLNFIPRKLFSQGIKSEQSVNRFSLRYSAFSARFYRTARIVRKRFGNRFFRSGFSWAHFLKNTKSRHKSLAR